LAENKLAGTIPLGYFPSFLVLKHIDKSNNVFTGYADMSFTTTTFYANFSHNEFAGVSLRRFNAAYQTLKVVDLSYNNISQDASKIFDDVPPNINSLPAKSCYGGEKKSVLLAKHKDTNIPTMMEPFSSSAAWF
jgi:hypothetical protein